MQGPPTLSHYSSAATQPIMRAFQMKLNHLLYLGFSILSISAISFTFIVVSSINTLSIVSSEVSNDDIPGVLGYLNILDEVADINTNALNYLGGDSNEKNNFQTNKAELNKFYEELLPLESVSDSDIKNLRQIRELSNNLIKSIEDDIFSVYDPINEYNANNEVKDITKQLGEPLEISLTKLKDSEFSDAYNSSDIKESLNDDLPGVRYYMELLDASGDMISSLNEYVLGDVKAKSKFSHSSNEFEKALAKLKPLERRAQEIEDISSLEDIYNSIIERSNNVFNIYNPKGKMAAKKYTIH